MTLLLRAGAGRGASSLLLRPLRRASSSHVLIGWGRLLERPRRIGHTGQVIPLHKEANVTTARTWGEWPLQSTFRWPPW